MWILSDSAHEDQGPCKGYHCNFDAECVVRRDGPQCECPTCSSSIPYEPVSIRNTAVYGYLVQSNLW